MPEIKGIADFCAAVFWRAKEPLEAGRRIGYACSFADRFWWSATFAQSDLRASEIDSPDFAIFLGR